MHNLPIVAYNTEFSVKVDTSSLTDVRFRLVDANFKPVKILTPIYLLCYAEAIEETKVGIERIQRIPEKEVKRKV
jgi:hypothetical protein